MKTINFDPKTLTAKSVLWAKSLFQAVTGSEMDWHSESSKFTHAVEQDTAERVERIRRVMLSFLTAGFPTASRQQLERRLRYATDVQTLWYLRGDLMAALSESTDERQAREKIQNITAMFRGLVPEAMFGHKATMH